MKQFYLRWAILKMKAKVNFDGNWLSDIEFVSHHFTLKVRFKRCLKTFSVFLCVSVLSVLIPVLHFFLVPVFLMLSFFLSYRKFMEVLSVELTRVSCPKCKTNFKDSTMGLRENDLVVRLRCDQCGKNLTLFFDN